MIKKYDYSKELMNHIDIMVDGEFVEEKKLADLKFRGSTNQRKIDVQASLKANKAVVLKFGDESRYEKEDKEFKDTKIVLFEEYKFKNESEEMVQSVAEEVTSEIVMMSGDANQEKEYIEINEAELLIAAKNIKKDSKENLD